ncbi:hypothetical protein JW926_09800 [Candidatus Sumerlaeota bacterium]|nr:hypothetical protein [Candidatus Sumerlaeota bacterium]
MISDISFRKLIPSFTRGRRIRILALCILQFIALYLHQGWSAPELNIPPRDKNALKGEKIVDSLAPLSPEEREKEIFKQFAGGNVPDFYRKLRPVSISAEIGGKKKNAIYYVIPDYLALGNDDDYFLTPMTPNLAQSLADFAGCCLPTRKMVNDIYAQAQVKLAPAPIPPSDQMSTVKVFHDHNKRVWKQRKDYLKEHPLGSLVAGNKKDVVITNKIHTYQPPPRVAIYGWHQPDGKPIQPLSLVHNASYADYSHGIRLVSLSMTVDGVSHTLTEVLAHPDLSALLSDEGPIPNPRYPNSSSPVSAQAQAPFNLVRNGSFEEDFKTGVGAFWHKWENKSLLPIFVGKAQRNIHDGKFAQYWARPDAGSFDGGVYQVVSVKPGDIYEISAWLKKQFKFQGAFMAFGYDLSGGTDASSPSVIYTDLSNAVYNSWIRYNAIVKATGSSLTLFARGGLDSMPGGDKVYFYLDHVSLVPVGDAATPTPDLSYKD